jgi:hypothetical protein
MLAPNVRRPRHRRSRRRRHGRTNLPPHAVERYAESIGRAGGVGIADSVVREFMRMQGSQATDAAPANPNGGARWRSSLTTPHRVEQLLLMTERLAMRWQPRTPAASKRAPPLDGPRTTRRTGSQTPTASNSRALNKNHPHPGRPAGSCWLSSAKALLHCTKPLPRMRLALNAVKDHLRRAWCTRWPKRSFANAVAAPAIPRKARSICSGARARQCSIATLSPTPRINPDPATTSPFL